MDRALTAEQMLTLDRLAYTALSGPRPGSNAWPLVEVEWGEITVSGEEIDDLIRRGLLVASPLPEVEFTSLTPAPDDLADFEIDLTHEYRVAHPVLANIDAEAGGE